MTYVFVFSQEYDNFTPFVILTRRRHLDNKTFFVFLKHVILKRENNTYDCASPIWRNYNTHTPLLLLLLAPSRAQNKAEPRQLVIEAHMLSIVLTYSLAYLLVLASQVHFGVEPFPNAF